MLCVYPESGPSHAYVAGQYRHFLGDPLERHRFPRNSGNAVAETADNEEQIIERMNKTTLLSDQ